MFEVQRFYSKQPYLQALFKALFVVSFYVLLRIGEVTDSPHTIKAKDVHIGINKKKIILVLFSSKTHNIANTPQKVKIEAINSDVLYKGNHENFCPFELMRHFMRLRDSYKNEEDQLFVYHDNIPVKAFQARKLLKLCLKQLGLNEKLYNFHSMRIGMATSLLKNNQSIEEVKRAGRWRSSAIYRYLKP